MGRFSICISLLPDSLCNTKLHTVSSTQCIPNIYSVCDFFDWACAVTARTPPIFVRIQKLTLTPRQQEVLILIIDGTVKHGYPPTIRELMDNMGIKSNNGIRTHLLALEKKGWIKVNGSSRGIAPVHPQVRAAICSGMLADLCGEVPGILHFAKAIEEEFTQAFGNQICY